MIEAGVVVEATCLYVSFTDAFGLIPDAAGIGGDGLGLANPLITVVAAVAVRGVCAAKYGNCVVLLWVGIVDASEESGAVTDSSLVDTVMRAV